MWCKIDDMWAYGTFGNRQKIQNLVFPAGITWNRAIPVCAPMVGLILRPMKTAGLAPQVECNAAHLVEVPRG